MENKVETSVQYEAPPDWRTAIALGRNEILHCIIGMNWDWSLKESKLRELQKQLDVIDQLLVSKSL